MTISQRANQVRQVPLQAKVGDLVFADFLDAITTLINVDPQAKQSDTVTVTGASDDTLYTFEIDGRPITIDSGTGATLTSIAAALAAKLEADPITRGRVTASAAVAVITLTALLAGQSYLLTESDGNLTAASVTTAAEADAIPFGRLVISDGFVPDEVNRQGKLPKASAFAAQVDTLVMPFVAAVMYSVSVTIDGVTHDATALADTSAAVTSTALAAAINGVLPANTVIATAPGDDLVLTAEIPGATFSTGFGASDEGASIPVFALSSTKGLATSLEQSAAGISLYSSDEEVTTIGGTAVEYPPNAGVRATNRSRGVWVESSQTPADGDPVYIETAAGDDTGKFFNTASATRVLLPRSIATWKRPARSDTTDNIAALAIQLAP